MVRSTGAQLGLLAFALSLVAGLLAGNSPATILIRAVVIMIAACALGQVVAWACKLVLRDHLQRRKREIDREHREAVRALTEPEEEAPEAAAPADVG